MQCNIIRFSCIKGAWMDEWIDVYLFSLWLPIQIKGRGMIIFVLQFWRKCPLHFFGGGEEGSWVIGPSHSIYIVNSAFFSDPSDMPTRWVRVIKVGTTSLIGVQWGYIKGKLPWPYSRRDECQSSSLGNYYEYDHEEPPYQIERSEWCGNDQGSAERETFSVEEFESHFKTIASHLSKGSEEEE